MAGKALQGLRVLELGSLIGAPFCGTLMAEFGADVIKVEDPQTGDMSRHLGQAVDGTGLMFAGLGRNKRCVTLDLRRPEGQALALELAATCDVLIENFRPGTLASWNLGWDVLSAANPRLVVAHVSGFGQTGPYRDRLAFDRIATAFSGQDWVTGFPDNPPTRPGGALADYITALFCTIGTMFALHHRDHVSGRGQEIDLALYEGILRIAGSIEAFGLLGNVPTRMGNSNPSIAPAETYRTGDGQWLSINAGTDNVWRRVLVLMQREDLATDPRFATARARATNHAAVNMIVADWVAQRPVDELIALLARESVPVTRINSIADVVADPHVRERGNVVEAVLASGRTFLTNGVVPKLSDSPGAIEFVAPPLGAHNDEVYGGLLGRSPEAIAALRRDRII
ncbi:MAG: CoA transferase [Burkholderiales bacterium]|jgi:crotonobetainyl-CoA:carnitine CoA-transferase CaiB-like acyl-CoA transferase